MSQVSTQRDHLSLSYFAWEKERVKHASDISRLLRHCARDPLLSYFAQGEVLREPAQFKSLGADGNNQKGHLALSSHGSASPCERSGACTQRPDHLVHWPREKEWVVYGNLHGSARLEGAQPWNISPRREDVDWIMISMEKFWEAPRISNQADCWSAFPVKVSL